MRIGVFGGSFDPVHLAHLILAEQGREQGRLDQVWFVPAARPPHKHGQLTPFDRRVEMLQLAVAGNPAFRVEELEKDRPGPSYTADTLDELATQHPGHDWALLVGSDTLRDLPGWHEPRRIVARAELLIMARPGAAVMPLAEVREKLGAEVRLTVAQMPLVDISSTEVRERLRTGRSVRYLVPRAVEMYALEKGLYRGAD